MTDKQNKQKKWGLKRKIPELGILELGLHFINDYLEWD
jgi:hypothetical protein